MLRLLGANLTTFIFIPRDYDGWTIISKCNKAKVKSFRLESRRSCTFQVYPNGKVVVALEFSYRPLRCMRLTIVVSSLRLLGRCHIFLVRNWGAINHPTHWRLAVEAI
jgi:hypothetical protein